VDNSNQRRLRELPGRTYRYDAVDVGDQNIRDKLLQNMMCPKMLELKVGAQVMLIKNLDEQLVNGSIGKVTRFETQLEWELGGGGSDAECEGLNDVERAKKKLKKFARDPDGTKDAIAYPIVEFSTSNGTFRTLQCIPDEWKVELPNGEVQAKRSQLPLILAWALSIHKAQGQTLQRVRVDLGRVFEKGQAYVALSRATSQHGLQVLRFDKQKVMAHARVVAFYGGLYSADQAAVRKQPTLDSMLQARAREDGTSRKFGSVAERAMAALPDVQESAPYWAEEHA
jgi:ATP-dependent DNA helicase PIF1